MHNRHFATPLPCCWLWTTTQAAADHRCRKCLLLCRPLAHLINFRYVPSDWRILFNNVIAIGWTTYLSFTCGGPSVVSPGGVEVAATAASTLLSVLPCHKVDDAMSLPGVGEAVQHVAAIEHIISCWGTKVGG